MQRFLYSLLLTLALPLLLIRLYLRSLRSPAYRKRIGERFAGKTIDKPDPGRSLIWFHAVSVGEVAAAEPLIRQLLLNPDLCILITTMTPTGSDRARALLGERVVHCYIPYDLPFLLKPFIRRMRPSLLVLMETELWPNLIHCCAQMQVPILLANARLSEKSARGYARLATLSRTMLTAIDLIAAQSNDDARRLQNLGAATDKITVTGSLKFNVDVTAVDNEGIAALRSLKASGRPVIIAASTREGEESRVLTAFRQVLASVPDAVLLLVPRHPERFDAVAELLEAGGFSFIRRSSDRDIGQDCQVVLGDSMGEMGNYYDCASIAFVGGSLVDTGCQNVLEPAARGIPVLVGPSQFNFAAICEQLERAGALRTVIDEQALASACIELVNDSAKSKAMGAAGQSLVTDNQQALPAHLRLIDRLLT